MGETSVKTVVFMPGGVAFHIFVTGESGKWPEHEKVILYYEDDFGEYFLCANPLERRVSVGDIVHWRRNDAPRDWTPGMVEEIRVFGATAWILLGPVPSLRQRIGKFLARLGL
jgi:hypothetical protein